MVTNALKTTSRSNSITEVDDDRNHYPNGSTTNTADDDLPQLISQELDFLEKSFQEARRRIDLALTQIADAHIKFADLLRAGERTQTELRELKIKLGKLRFKIPFSLIIPDDEPNPNVNWRPRSNPQHQPLKPVHDRLVDNSGRKPNFDDEEDHPSHDYLTSSLGEFNSSEKSFPLWVFLIFPAKAIITKGLMVHWMGTNTFTPYHRKYIFKDIIDRLIEVGFIKPIYKESRRSLCGYWMHSYVRYTLNDCLSVQHEKYLVSSTDVEDTIYSGSADFSAMKYLEFLHLGKWEMSSTHHVEMEDPDLYFKDIKNMDNLRYMSFRGISMITELPKLVTGLKKLEVLDLKACYNLEAIPYDIGNLRYSLTHLDMSECYFVDHMPASLSRLVYLQVLKGFVVGETTNEDVCTLQDMASFQHLMKLNIYTSVKKFPNEDQLTALQKLRSLRKLTISWGGCAAVSKERKSSPTSTTTNPLQRLFTREPDPVVEPKEFSFSLQKLDLQCVPEKITHNWLRPSNFRSLKTLYIRGGQFNDLSHMSKGYWSVEILRLKHLSKLQIDWSELGHFFPRLKSLQKVQCPNLTSFPCDESGLWTKKSRW